MNPFATIAVKIYGGVAFVMFLLPAVLLSFTAPSSHFLKMIGWSVWVYFALTLAAAVFGWINSFSGRSSWIWSICQSMIVLLITAIAAITPTIWVDSKHDIFIIGGWMMFYGVGPALFAGLLYKGATERIINSNRN